MSDLIWDRQPAESSRAFAAFVVYRDMGTDRSLDKAYTQTRGNQSGPMKAPGCWKQWSIKHEWPARAQAYDAALRAREAAQREQAQAAEAEKWAARRAEEANEEWELSRKLIERARGMLAFPLQTQEIADGDGRTVIVKPARWTLRDAASLIDTAAKLARLAAGMETGRETGVEVRVKVYQDVEADRI